MSGRDAVVLKANGTHSRTQGWHGQISPPHEFVRIKAYEKYEIRGYVNGDDWVDWFEAEEELRTLFAAVEWVAERQPKFPPGLVLVPMGPDNVLEELCRYFRRCPESKVSISDQATPFSVLWPEDEHGSHPNKSTEMAAQDPPPMAVESAQVVAARSPVALLPPEEFVLLRGKLVALLLSGSEKGKVIASAPLDYEHPEIPRRQIKEQVASSPYKNRRYQVRQILESPDAD
jgi:hypothetical protein